MMTNSEIITEILRKNPKPKASELRKVQVLQLAAQYGTADDIRAVFNAYGEVEFFSGALAYACEQGDIGKVYALIENKAYFYTGNMRSSWIAKYHTDQWNYILYISTYHKTYRFADNPELAEKYTSQTLMPLPGKDVTVKDRADIIQLLFPQNKQKGSDERYCGFNYSQFIVSCIVIGDCALAKEILSRGVQVNEWVIQTINDVSFMLCERLAKLSVVDCAEALNLLCDIAQKANTQVSFARDIYKFCDVFFSTTILPILLGRCELSRIGKKDLIEAIITYENTNLLSILEKYEYFNLTRTRKAAVSYAKEKNYQISYNWLVESTDRIIETVQREKDNNPVQRTQNDSANAKWFIHKGSKITGLSKKGIKEINAEGLTTLEFPEMVDGIKIDTIRNNATDEFGECVPTIQELVLPANITIERKSYYECHFTWFPTAVSIKKLVITTNDYVHFPGISNSIESIVINDSELYLTIDGVVFNKDVDTLIFYPRSKKEKVYSVPSSVKTIRKEAFSQCYSLESIILPEDLSIIETRAFYNNNLKIVDIPSSIKKISKSAFSGCSHIKKLTFHEGLEEICEEAFDYCGADHVTFPCSLRKIGKDAFRNSTSTFTFLSDDILIGPHAFYGCKKENTNYSVKIEGKMQRCGYSQYDYYDGYCYFTRDQAIEKLRLLAETEIDVPEEMQLDQIQEKISAYELIKNKG